jgi:hypothetical protein
LVEQRHPKFTHYPYLRDYGFGQTARPFVSFVNPPHYRSRSVNIDGLGLREQYDADGTFIDVSRARESYDGCNLVMGGSTTFGVGATSDRATIAAHLQSAGRPFLNLGVRAASSRQELAIFLGLRHLLPRPHDIVLFSGVNECVFAGNERLPVHPGYGAAFNPHEQWQDGIGGKAEKGGAPSSLHDGLDRIARTGHSLRRGRLPSPGPQRVDRSAVAEGSFDDRLDALLGLTSPTLETWRIVADATGARVVYVLQPVMSWTDKPLTSIEEQLLQADRDTIPAVPKFTRPQVYQRVRDNLSEACSSNGIAFHDANAWLGSEDSHNLEFFVDVAHLTDEGYASVARRLGKELETHVPDHSLAGPGVHGGDQRPPIAPVEASDRA